MNNKTNAAEKFAAKIKELIEQDCIEALTIKVHASNSDELFKLAHEAGIKDVTICSFGCM